jgi:hypothetical protein
MIEIEKDRPLPEERVRNSYPFKQMEVGDSFHVEGVNMQVVLNANYRAGKQLGAKFIARKDERGVRVWRIS